MLFCIGHLFLVSFSIQTEFYILCAVELFDLFFYLKVSNVLLHQQDFVYVTVAYTLAGDLL